MLKYHKHVDRSAFSVTTLQEADADDRHYWRNKTPHERLAFGFDVPALTPALFTKPDQIIRMGYPPLRSEVMTSIDGVAFDACIKERIETTWDDLIVPVINIHHLRQNKRASGRLEASRRAWVRRS